MLGAAGREHRQIALGKAVRRPLVDGIQRIDQAIAEGIGVDVERRVHEVRDVGPEGLVAGLELDRRTEALVLHLQPERVETVGGELAAKVEDMINTVVRQIAFYTFERSVHLERRNGELTADRLNALWLEVQHESLGPAIELKPGYETFWAYIPHFVHSPFYVYAYAFGDCLVNSLYSVYERSNQGFAERYLKMLAAGGTKSYSELLAPFGLDARDPAFWQGGLGVIDRMITELEGLG